MTCTVLYSLFFFAYITKENKTFVRIYSKVITGTCDVSYMYRYADPIAGRHEAHLRKATRSGVKSARAKEQVNEIAEATQQSTKSGRLHLSYNDNNLTKMFTLLSGTNTGWKFKVRSINVHKSNKGVSCYCVYIQPWENN